MEVVSSIIATIDTSIWGIPMIVILSCVHLFCTWKTGFIQRKLPQAIKLSFTKDPQAEGDISQFGALCTALSATLGVGCIVGVATAIISGGPGAVFWMWLMGILGMATKYSETFVAIKYRVKDMRGGMMGGAMYVWERAFSKKSTKKKPLGDVPKWAKAGAIFFAVFAFIATFGTGSSVQSATISSSIVNYFPDVPQWSIAILIVVLSAFTIFGGVKAIANICEKLTPFMTLAYIAGLIAIFVINWEFFFPAISLILESAFTPKAAFGGAVGSGIAVALQYGVSRGLLSNESGLGTAPIVAAAASTKNPARQSLVSMTGAFWSTVVLCALTGIAITASMLANPDLVSADSQVLTLKVFEQIPYVGGPLLCLSIVLFAFSTIIGWSYYANRAITYLFGSKAVQPFMVIYLLALLFGGLGMSGIVWNLADITNALMALPNVIVVVLLAKIIKKETKFYVWDNNLDAATKDVAIRVDK